MRRSAKGHSRLTRSRTMFKTRWGGLFTRVRGETVWQSGRGRSMTCAPRHEEEILHRPVRRPMEVPRAPCSGAQRARTAEDPHHPRGARRRLLSAEGRLPVAAVAPRLPAVGDRLSTGGVRKVARRRDLRAAQRRPARGPACPFGQGPAPERRHRRLPVGQNHRGGRRAERGYDGGKRCAAGSVTCWWTPRVWSSRPRSTERQGARPGGRTQAPTAVRADRALAPEAPVASPRKRSSTRRWFG